MSARRSHGMARATWREVHLTKWGEGGGRHRRCEGDRLNTLAQGSQAPGVAQVDRRAKCAVPQVLLHAKVERLDPVLEPARRRAPVNPGTWTRTALRGGSACGRSRDREMLLDHLDAKCRAASRASGLPDVLSGFSEAAPFSHARSKSGRHPIGDLQPATHARGFHPGVCDFAASGWPGTPQRLRASTDTKPSRAGPHGTYQ